MARIQSNDHRAFTILVRRHAGRFFATAYRMCAQTQEAEDIVQEAFLKIWQKPEIWVPGRGAKFTTWFTRVVMNLAVDRMRSRRLFAGDDTLMAVADNHPGQAEVLQRDQEQEALEKAIQNLPERQKMALNLCFYEQMSNKEAARVLNVNVKALESLLMRAKTTLRNEMIRGGFVAKAG